MCNKPQSNENAMQYALHEFFRKGVICNYFCTNSLTCECLFTNSFIFYSTPEQIGGFQVATVSNLKKVAFELL